MLTLAGLFLCVVEAESLFIRNCSLSQSIPYYGASLGTFSTVTNNVKGEAFAVDAGTIFIKDFSYDGHSEDSVFWAGSSENPDNNGFALTNETSEFKTIHPYNNHNVILRLPKGKNLKDIRWLSVWNRISSKSLGTLIFSKPIHPPEPLSIGPLINTKKGVSTGDILIIDTQAFLIQDFSYDGSEKETYWWLSIGKEPDERGVPLLENGSDAPLEETVNRTVLITLPKGHFVADYETLSIWNRLDGDNYGFSIVPKKLNVPPSSRILGIEEPEMTDFNCEILNDKLGLQVRWVIAGYDAIIYLIGNIGPNEYMALGLSKDDTETRFDSADGMVVGLYPDGKAFATDYFFESNRQCENGLGMCLDSIHGSDDNLELLYAERYENSTAIIFKRHLRAEDNVYDQNIYTDGPQAILWAVGSFLPEGVISSPTFHNKKNLLLDFGRGPSWNCPPLQLKNPSVTFSEGKIQHIHCPGERSFRAQLGSSSRRNDKKVWFINGLATPKLTVQRGIAYTFIIEGGLEPPYHHPFYITNNKEGGLYNKILKGNETEVTFTGIQQDPATGKKIPTAEGRLCDWSYSDISPEYSVITSHQNLKPTLALKCEPGEPGKLIWTPTADTPNEVYYQSFTERGLGGKIHVVDFCEETNPHRYLEISIKGGKAKTNPHSLQKGELERESDEYDLFLSMEDKITYVKETRIKHQEEKSIKKSNATGIIHENYPPKVDKYTLSSNVINSFKVNPDNPNERMPGADDKYLSEITSTPQSFRVSESVDDLFPHDESERADVYLPNHSNFGKDTLNSPRNTESLSKYPTHSASELSSISALENKPLQVFRPHFEGGFVPLVMNPMKEKEFAQTKEFIYPTHQRSRPHRPFLYNESVPFHGTFKPGVPDFSGFNISNYSQEDASIIIAPNQDNLSILSASKPQPVHKPFSPFGAIPLHLLQRHNEPPPRHQRPQDIGYRFHQQPTLVGMRKNIFPHLPLNNKPNFPIPNTRDQDLAGISSQRVYVSMQATGDKNVNHANIPNMPHSTSYNRNQQNPPPNKMIYPPPIQRRPDFYEEKELGIHQPNGPKINFKTPPNPANINNKHNQPKLNFPILKSGGLQRQANIRPLIQNSNVPIKNLQGHGEQAMVAQGPLRYPYPTMQIPPRERHPQASLFPKGMPIRPNPSRDEKLKMIDGFMSHPQNFPFPFPLMNFNEKESKESQILDTSSSKKNRHMPQLINAELVEVPSKNIPQTFQIEKSTMHPRLLMQKTPFNASLNAFSPNTNIRVSQIIPPLHHPKNLPFGKTSNFSILPSEHETSVSNFKKEETIFSEIKNNPFNPNNHEIFEQNLNSGTSQITAEKEPGVRYGELHKESESHPTDFHQHELVKSVLKTSVPADISSSKPAIIRLPTLSDYESEDVSDIDDSIISYADYSDYNVPFGARLKFSQNGSQIPVRNANETPKRPFGITRRPEMNVPNTPHRSSNGFVKASTSTSTTTSTTTTESPIVAMESKQHFDYNNKQNTSSEKEEYIKNLYYTPPLSSLPELRDNTNSSTNLNQYIGSSNEVKHIPIIADTLDGIVETNHGRKHMLPNNSNSGLPPFVVPPKASEDINLPQISQNPPTNDNKTDYSILNHILTLIGGPPEPKAIESSS